MNQDVIIYNTRVITENVRKCMKIWIKQRDNGCKCTNNFNVPDYNALVHGQVMNDIIIYRYIAGKRPSTGAANTVVEKPLSSCHSM